MFYGSLAFVFEVMVYVGLGLPLLSLLLSVIGGMSSSGSGAAPEMQLDIDTDLDLDLDFDPGADLDVDFTPDLAAPQADGALDVQATSGGGGFPIRFNIYCLCLFLVVLGAVGMFSLVSLSGTAQILGLLAGVALAVLAYTLLYRFVVLPLKRNNAAALNAQSLRFRHARVTFRITPESPGKIITRDAVGAAITWAAHMDTDLCKAPRIEEGAEVVVTDIDSDKKICYVAPAQRRILE